MTRLEHSLEVPKRHENLPKDTLFDDIGFRHKSAEDAAKAFSDRSFEHCVYGRITHPNTNALAKIFAEIEGGEDALVFSSGMAATITLILALCKSGDSIISSSRIYGGTYGLFDKFLPAKNNILTRFINRPEDLRAWQQAIETSDPPAKLLFLETPGNPLLGVFNIEEITDLGHKFGIPMAVDNSMGLGIQKPISFQADASVASLTKTASRGKKTGGVVAGSKDLILKCLEVRAVTGSCMDHDIAFKLTTAARTANRRMERHSQNALSLAELLKDNGYTVHYPGFSSPEEQALVQKQMGGFGGCMLSFEVKQGGNQEAMKLLNMLRDQEVLDIVTHFGEEKVTTGIHPATTTHSMMDENAQLEAGISGKLIRISADATAQFKKTTLPKFKEVLETFEAGYVTRP